MSKMKKVLLMCTAYALVAVLAIGGTLAYFTDRDSEVNTFTVGDVAIDLTEEFEQGAELIPGVKIDKNAQITNTGKNDAWVWLTALLPKELGPYTAPDNLSASNNVVHWNYPKANADNIIMQFESVPVSLDPDGDGEMSDYYRTSLLYNKVLAPEAATGIMLSTVYMDTHIDIAPNGDWYWVKDGGETIKLDWNSETSGLPKLYVSAYAIQADQFADVNAAYAAYNKQWGENGDEYNDNSGFVENEAELEVALAKGGKIMIGRSFSVSNVQNVTSDTVIGGNGFTISRAAGFTGTVFNVGANATLQMEDVVVDGGGSARTSITATGNLIAAESNAKILLNNGAVLQNNVGAHAVNLGTRIGATLTLDGGEIINNSSDSGAIWGGGDIVINSGRISYNSSTGSAGAIRMVGKCNLTMNGGEISHNTAAADGGAIWGYGVNGNTSVYNLNGGKISHNTAGGVGGAIYTGTYSTINMSGDFEICNNTAADSGAFRLTNYTILNMTGGKIAGNVSSNEPKYDGFYGWCPRLTLGGGELQDNIYIAGGHTPTVGATKITGIVYFNVSTNHNTINLASDFGSFKFYAVEGDNFSAFNFKPASDYTYTAGDEAKLVCMNEGYVTYWDAATASFRLKAN